MQKATFFEKKLSACTLGCCGSTEHASVDLEAERPVLVTVVNKSELFILKLPSFWVLADCQPTIVNDRGVARRHTFFLRLKRISTSSLTSPFQD